MIEERRGIGSGKNNNEKRMKINYRSGTRTAKEIEKRKRGVGKKEENRDT